MSCGSPQSTKHGWMRSSALPRPWTRHGCHGNHQSQVSADSRRHLPGLLGRPPSCPRVVLDSTVLVARAFHEPIGRLGTKALLDVWWSDELLAETVRILHSELGYSKRQAVAVAGYVRAAFPQNKVTARAQREAVVDVLVRDPNDAHVAAVAVAAGADYLVTANSKDFVRAELANRMITLIHPDDLLLAVLNEDATAVREALEASRNPNSRVADLHGLLSLIRRAGAVNFATEAFRMWGLPPPDPTPSGSQTGNRRRASRRRSQRQESHK